MALWAGTAPDELGSALESGWEYLVGGTVECQGDAWML